MTSLVLLCGIFSLAAAISSWFIPRKQGVLVLWIPATFFWLVAFLYLAFIVQFVPNSGFFGEAIVNLVIIGFRVITGCLVLLNLIRVPRGAGADLKFGAIGIAIFATGAGTIVAADFADHRVAYKFVAADARGKPIADFSIQYRYRSERVLRLTPEQPWETGTVVADSAGRAKVVIYATAAAMTVTSPTACTPQTISVYDGKPHAVWTAMTARGPFEAGSEIKLNPITRLVQIQLQTSTAYPDLLIYNVSDPSTLGNLDLMGKVNRLLCPENADVVLARCQTVPSPEDGRNYVVTTLLTPLRALGEITDDEYRTLGYPPIERRHLALTQDELSLIQERAKSLRKKLGAGH